MRSQSPTTQRDALPLLQIERDLASGHPLARLLYLTPEALFSRHFLNSLKKVVLQKELRRLVIDEAHCISVSLRERRKDRAWLIFMTQEWGSSFRPVCNRQESLPSFIDDLRRPMH